MAALRDPVDELCGFERRGPCTDAERRAALALHDRLRARGHEAWVETVWVRPQWPQSLALHAALGVAASLVATAASATVPALAVAALALVSYALETAGAPGLLRLAFYRRATQVVVVEPPDPDKIVLWLTAHTDAPRRGLVLRDGWRRAAARLPLRPRGWILLALAGVAAAAAARVAGAEGNLVGALQFVPTILLVLAFGAAIDIALSDVSPGANDAASAVAVALAAHETLTADPCDELSVGLLLAGAGEDQPLGLRGHLRAERPRPQDTVIAELGPCGSGTPTWSTRHKQLRHVCERAGPQARGPRRARVTRLPSLTVAAGDHHGVAPRARTQADVPEAVDDATLDACVDLVLAIADELDLELRAAQAAAPGSV